MKQISIERKMVLEGKLDQTKGGLRKVDLLPDGRSKKAVEASLKRMKIEGPKHLTKVFPPAKKGFKLQPKVGTKAYDKKIKKMKK